MDEQRLEAYYQLIQQLLSCPHGEEAAILQANRELLDVDFLELLKVGVEQMSTQEGQENRANRLLALASQLSEQLDIPLTPEPETPLNQANFDTYLQFLSEVLQATAESRGNPQVVYPLLAANTDKLNLTFVKLLQLLATKTLEEEAADTAKSIAVVIGEFSNLIKQFPLGNKADNMEIAITGYEIAFTVFTRTDFPVDWATTQNNLGNAYSDRIRGDKADNLEIAIAAYNAALEVYTRTDFPVQWATTQNNLGTAYSDRIRGDKADNLEIAIAAYNAALEVYTRTDFPVQWATTQNNLGNAYLNRIRGDKAENLEIAIAAYNAALEVRTRTDFPVQWAATQNNLGNAYSNSIRGDKADNLEKAIAAYNNALEVRTPTDFPQEWAGTQNNLGATYNNRIRGDKADNLENAIAAFNAALEVYTRTAFPKEWAGTQNNLGNAYNNRISGDKADNLEIAIAAYQQALEVRTRTDFPVDWATTQNNLGTAYSDRIRGDKADNLEIAIAAYQQALEVRTRTDFPVDWATTQNNLGNAYSDRIRGDKADNLENAIAAYQQALEVYTRTDFPVDWARTQNNLGTAYCERIRGDKADNLEIAIAAYEQALEVYTRTDFPVEWARTQNNLGAAYNNRIRGDKAKNLEIAIAAYNNALEVRTPTDFPQEWAGTQNNLGATYDNRIRGDKADNLENAIAAFNAALEVYTRTAFPKEWATTQNNLGNAYNNRISGDKADNLEIAIAAYNNALEVRTPTDFPVENAETLFNLGIAYQDSQQFDLAYDTFKSAIATVEGLRGEIISGEESKRKQAEEWNKLFVLMVEVCLVLGKETEAISYIERSKTRNLVELIAEKVGFNPIQYPEIQNLLDDKTAIIQFYIFKDCFRAFIITKNNDKPIIWKSTKEDLHQLRDWVYDEYLTLYYSDRKKWRNNLNDQLNKLAKILHINEIIAQVPKHIQKIIIIPHRYLHLLPFHAIPLSTNSEYLFDKYPEGVSYAPSCQLLNIAKERLSNPLLQGERTRLSNLFAIQDPNNNLRFTNIEVETIAASFDPQQILKNNEASKANLQETTTFNKFTNSQWLHFSCHGSFDLQSPLKSALQLADSEVNPSLLTTSSSGYARINEETAIDLSKCLTLAEILELNLPQCYLVCLSACETGVIDFKNNSDEFIGLSSGFIKAGAVNIVSSLWTVSDVHTAILMIKLYENIANNPQDITLALNAAQQWLRQATQVEIIDWLKQKTEMKEEQKQEIINSLSTKYKPEHQPFNKPYFWAGFCAVSPVISPV